MDKYCSNCGKENIEQGKYCPYCGAQLIYKKVEDYPLSDKSNELLQETGEGFKQLKKYIHEIEKYLSGSFNILIKEIKKIIRNIDYIAFLNSTTLFLLAFVIVFFVRQVATFITAYHYGFKGAAFLFTDIYIYSTDSWTFFNKKIINLSGPIVSLVFGLIFFNLSIFLKKISYSEKYFYTLLAFHGFIFFLIGLSEYISFGGNYGFQSGVNSGKIHNNFSGFISITFLVLLIVFGFFNSRRLISLQYPVKTYKKFQRIWPLFNYLILPLLISHIIISILFRFHILEYLFAFIPIILGAALNWKATPIKPEKESVNPKFQWQFLFVLILILVLLKYILRNPIILT